MFETFEKYATEVIRILNVFCFFQRLPYEIFYFLMILFCNKNIKIKLTGKVGSLRVRKLFFKKPKQFFLHRLKAILSPKLNADIYSLYNIKDRYYI